MVSGSLFLASFFVVLLVSVVAVMMVMMMMVMPIVALVFPVFDSGAFLWRVRAVVTIYTFPV